MVITTTEMGVGKLVPNAPRKKQKDDYCLLDYAAYCHRRASVRYLFKKLYRRYAGSLDFIPIHAAHTD